MYVASYKPKCPSCRREHIIGVFGEVSGYVFPEPSEISCPCGVHLIVALDGYEISTVRGATLLVKHEYLETLASARFLKGEKQ